MAQTLDITQSAAGDSHIDDHGGHHHEPPHEGTGVENRKLMIWLFLASDCMFFGSLIATYMIYRNRAVELGVGPFPHELIDIPFTSVSAFVLLMSSLTMVLSLGSLQKGHLRNSRIWLAATAILGLTFLGGQFFEFTEFYHEGLTLQGNIFGSAFFTLTGFHGLHVGLGVLWLLSLLFVSFRGGLKQENAVTLEIAGLYWHFVDIVWIIIFTLVYLLPYARTEGGESETAARGMEIALSLVQRF